MNGEYTCEAASTTARDCRPVGFLEFQPVETRKLATKVWRVRSVKSGGSLGLVSWWSPWRRYTFQPSPATFFDAGCLAELAEFCKLETEKRKEERAE